MPVSAIVVLWLCFLVGTFVMACKAARDKDQRGLKNFTGAFVLGIAAAAWLLLSLLTAEVWSWLTV